MSLQSFSQDRPDVQQSVRHLTTRMVKPIGWNFKGLNRLMRYLIGTVKYGVLMAASEGDRYPCGTVELGMHMDTDWAADKETWKSVVCCHHQLDGCCISNTVRQQSFSDLSSAEAERSAVR